MGEESQDVPVTPESLSDFRGGPFPEHLIRTAIKAIRRECGWIIGPQTTETCRLYTSGRSLTLPTLHLVDVVSIRDADDPDSVPLAGRRRVEPEGRVRALSGARFPEYAEIEFVHGFKEWPEELNLIIASLVRDMKSGRIRSESLASRSITLEAGADTKLIAPVLDAYRLSARPGEGDR